MFSNERPSPYGRRPYPNYRPPVNEDTLKAGVLEIERKTFAFTLKENVRGRLLRITEEVGGRRNSIIVPASGLVEFQKVLAEMIKASEELPAASASPKPE